MVGKFGVVRDHDDEPLARDLFDELHDLHARLRIERARGFVRKEDIGIIDERARNGDALHLPARELIGFFVELIAQTDARKRLGGAAAALFPSHARDGERKLHVPEHRLVRDEVIRLEDEPDPVIAVDVPIPVFEVFRGLPLNDEIARRIMIESADDVEERRLAAAGRSEHADKFARAEFEAHPFERVNAARGGFVFLGDVGEFEHGQPYSL